MPFLQLSGEAVKPSLDVSDWPVVRIDTGDEPISDQELLEFCDEYTTTLRANEGPYAVVQDTTKRGDMSPKQRRILGDHMRDHRELTQRCVGYALVFRSSILKHLLTAILWVNKPDYELKVFTDLAEANAWVSGRLRRDRTSHVA